MSKALLISFVTRCVVCVGLGKFRPSCMYCVIVVRSVVVEYRALKPGCVGDKGMCGVIVLRISIFRISIG